MANMTGDREPGSIVEQSVNDKGLAEAAKWLGVHQRYGIQDAQRMNRIEERLRRLERPWWRFWR